MPGAGHHTVRHWCSAILHKLRSYQLLTLPVTLLVVLAFGWYLVLQQNQLLAGATVAAYQQTELQMARVLALSVDRYMAERAEEPQTGNGVAAEQDAASRYIDPVRLLASGGAWLYAPGRGLVDSGSGLTETLAARTVSGALEARGDDGVPSGLAQAVGAGGEGTYWLDGSTTTASQVVAWAPVSTGDGTLLVGIAVPLDEILASTGVIGQVRALTWAMMVASMASVVMLVAWLRSETGRMESEAALRRAHQELEGRVLERTAALSQANAALSYSERRYHEFADSLPQFVFETDAHGVFSYVNRAAIQALALTPDRMATGVSAMALMAPGSRERIYQDMLRVLSGEELVGTEYEICLGNGTTIPALMHANVVKRDGVPVGIRGVVVDISERKAAEEALRQSEGRFRDMLERVQLFAAILDSSGHIIFGNPCLLQATGWEWSELAGADWFDTFVPPENREYLRGRFSEYVRPDSQPMRHRVQQVMTRDGGRRTVFWNIIALFDGDGKLTGSASLGEDITDRLRAERALQESEERYRALFDSTNDALFVHPVGSLDGSGRYIEVNETACRMLGYTRDELLGLSPVQIATPEAVPQMAQALRSLADADRILFETAQRTKDGRTLSVEVNACLFEYRGEMAVLSTVRDISERRRLEEQLLQSRKMESIGRLAGGIAHDFNNILTAITGHASFALEDSTMAPDTRQELSDLLHAADRASDLTRQLLAFSRRQVIAPRLIRLNELIADMARMLERMVGESFSLRTELADDLWPTNADPTQIQQVLTNLVVNGRDAMSSGGCLTVRTANAELRDGPLLGELEVKPGAYVTLSVSDGGSGMSEEVRSRIFEPFFTTKDLGKGTGMGLSTALGIVKQHHGGIRVVSEVGKGTTFEVYLPRAFDTVGHEDDTLPLEGLPTGSETVLLVEDDEHVRALTARTLRRLGYHVLEAANGEAAEAAVHDRDVPVDLLLADIVMSGINGHELAKRLLASRPGLKVLFVSGYPRAAVSDDDLADDSDRLLAKPFTSMALAHKVRQLLDRDAAAAD